MITLGYLISRIITSSNKISEPRANAVWTRRRRPLSADIWQIIDKADWIRRRTRPRNEASLKHFDGSRDVWSDHLAECSRARTTAKYVSITLSTRKNDVIRPILLRRFSKIHAVDLGPLLQTRAEVYGRNILPPPKYKSFGRFMFEALKDKTLIVLSIAAVVEIAIGIFKIVSKNNHLAIVDGVAILIASMFVQPRSDN